MFWTDAEILKPTVEAALAESAEVGWHTVVADVVAMLRQMTSPTELLEVLCSTVPHWHRQPTSRLQPGEVLSLGTPAETVH